MRLSIRYEGSKEDHFAFGVLSLDRSRRSQSSKKCCRVPPHELILGRGIVAAAVRLVPDLPIFDVHVIPVCPAVVVMADDAFAYTRPFAEILRRQRAVFFRPVLDAAAESVKWLGSGQEKTIQVFIGKEEII